jgi:hypothetical protein
MRAALCMVLAFASLAISLGPALADNADKADKYDDTLKLFKNAGQSAAFFDKSYGYAVFPTVGKGGLGVGAAHGSGRVYRKGQYVGNTSMTQLSLGLQAGGQAFSQIIFFEDQRAFDEFTSGHFEFGHDRHDGGRERRQKGRKDRRRFSQGNRRLHNRKGRRDVRSISFWPEVLLRAQSEVVESVTSQANGTKGGWSPITTVAPCNGIRCDRWRCRSFAESEPPGGSAGSSSGRTDRSRP